MQFLKTFALFAFMAEALKIRPHEINADNASNAQIGNFLAEDHHGNHGHMTARIYTVSFEEPQKQKKNHQDNGLHIGNDNNNTPAATTPTTPATTPPATVTPDTTTQEANTKPSSGKPPKLVQ